MIGFSSAAKTPAPQTTQNYGVPAPLGGMDARTPAANEDPNSALILYNLVPGEYSLEMRSGYRVWAEDLNGEEVRTIIPYSGLPELSTGDRLFAVTKEGIWDVTTAGGPSTLKLSFISGGDNAGFGVYTHYVNDDGTDTLYYADGDNGLCEYSPTLDTWALATGITPVVGSVSPFDVANVVYVVSHKLRIWFVQKESNVGWYLPVQSKKGEVTEFLFASKFKHGGALVGLYNWSVDGGDGLDDYLVALSRAGDVIPFRGEDPSNSDGSGGVAPWQNVGTFYIGNVPRGNRVASEYGGELYLLSTFGIISMKDLLQGVEAGSTAEQETVGFKIASLLRRDLRNYTDSHGWNIKFVTREGMLLISTPERLDGTYRQYVYNISTQGWGLWRDVPLLTSDPWEGELMVGDKNGRVLRMDVEADNVQLDGTGAEAIKFFVLTAYQDLGSPGIHKRLAFIRPNWVAKIPPSYDVFAYYDFDVEERLAPLTPGPIDIAQWDDALWNVGLWSGGQIMPDYSLLGAGGMGRSVAVGMSGSSQAGGRLLSWDVAYNEGWFL